MTASVSRPATSASTASRCPGRSSEKPKTSRATRSMAGGTAWGMSEGLVPGGWVAANIVLPFPSGLARVPNWCRGTPPDRGGEMFERIRARRFQRERDADPAEQGGQVATARRTDPRAGNGYPDDDGPDGDNGGTATTTRARTRDRTATGGRTTGAAAAGTAAERAHLRARDEFGGINWGAAFFGWLVATGLATILIA